MSTKTTSMTLSQELAWRGFFHQTTFKDASALDDEQRTFFFGVDPSAPSMTIGNLASVMMVRCFLKHGYKGIILIGGATGLIGDPDGKADERNLKSMEVIEQNKQGILAQYKTIFGDLPHDNVDNYDWFKDLGYLEFLREVGKHVPMRQMLGRDFVQSRLSEDGSGISYAEFSYSLIQGYDFVHLAKTKGVSLQLCGADQWGNCIAGVDLARRMLGREVHIWSTPLIVNKSTGVKFGKSEEGAIWLDASLTSPYKFYQFWLNLDDDGVEDYLKVYTELDKAQIDDIMKRFNEDRSIRLAQKTLAFEATAMMHGKDTAESVTRVSKTLFGGASYDKLTAEDFAILKAELGSVKAELSSNLIELLVSAGLASSKGEARRFLESRAVYINGQQVDSDKDALSSSDNIHGFCVLRRGKNSQVVIEL